MSSIGTSSSNKTSDGVVHVVPLRPSARVKATTSLAADALVDVRVRCVLPQSAQRAQQRVAALKQLFVLPHDVRAAAHRSALHTLTTHMRLTRSVRNVRIHDDHLGSSSGSAAAAAAAAAATATTHASSVVGMLCMPLCSCAAVPSAVHTACSNKSNTHSSWVLTGAVDGLLVLWDATTCTPLATASTCQQTTTAAAASRASGSSSSHDKDDAITLSTTTAPPRRSAAWGRVRSIAAHPHAPLCFTATAFDRGVTAWSLPHDGSAADDVDDGNDTARRARQRPPPQRMTMCAYGCDDTAATTTMHSSDSNAHGATASAYAVRCLAADPTGHLLASVGDDARMRVWDVRTLTPCTTCNVYTDNNNNNNNSSSSSARAHTTLSCLYAQDGYETAGGVNAVAFHGDGSLVSTADDGGRVVTWDVRSGAHAFTTAGSCGAHLSRATCVTWLPCGVRFASGAAEATVHVYDARMLHRERSRGNAAATTPLCALLGHEDVVTSVGCMRHTRIRPAHGGGGAAHADDVNNNNKRNSDDVDAVTAAMRVLPLALSTTSLDGTLRVWDADSGCCVRTFTADAPLYSHCYTHAERDNNGSGSGSARRRGGDTAAADDDDDCAIVTVGHSKYWHMYECVAPAHDDGSNTAGEDAAVAAAARDAARAVRVYNTTHIATTTTATSSSALQRHATQTSDSDSDDDDDEMAQLLRRKDDGAHADDNNNNNDDDDEDDEDDEMQLLRRR